MFYNVLSADAAATGGLGGMSSILFLVIIFVVFYFFFIRPENKRKKKLTEIALARKDAVTALFQRLVVQREHGAIGVPIDPAELTADGALRNRTLARIEQAVLRPLDARELGRLVVEFQ